MSEKIKAVIVGTGNTGIPMVRYMADHGIRVTGAVDIHPELIGKDLGELTETDIKGVTISGDLSKVLEEADPDIALICTVSLLEDVYETALTCLEHGVNVLTTAEKAFSPYYNPNRDLVAKLDEAAKANGVSMLASGVQDVLWVGMATQLSSLCNKIERIHGVNYALIDGFGPMCLEEAFVGKQLSEFGTGDQLNDDFNYALSVLAAALHLKVTEEDTKVTPLIAEKDLYSEEADVHVKAGEIVGVLTNTTMQTEEGIVLSADFYEKLREEGDTEKNEWSIEGEPSLTVTMRDMFGEETTCTTVLNRIPDVINAEPGYISAADLPLAKYHAHSMEDYLR